MLSSFQYGESSLWLTLVQSTIKNIIQAVAIFAIAQFAVNAFIGSKNKTSIPEAATFNAKPDSTVVPGEYNPIPQSIAPIWPLNSSLDISIYVSPSLIMPSLDRAPRESLILEEKDFTLGDWKDKRVIDTTFPVPKEAQQNGTLWAHFYVALHGNSLDPTAGDYNVATAYHFFRPLNQVLAKKKVVKTKRLLGSSNSTEDDAEPTPSGPVLASYYHPNFTMSFIPDSGYQSYVNMHPAVRSHVTLEATGTRDKTGQNGWYYPVLYVNTFWQLRDHMIEMNNTIKTLPIHITLNNLNNWKFALYASVDESVKTNQRNIAAGGPVTAQGDGSEFEEFKRVLIDTNIYLLSTTAIVSVLHMIFEMLAFKSDIVSPPPLSDAPFPRPFPSHCPFPQTNPLPSPTGATKKTTSASPSAPSSQTSSCKPSSSFTSSTTATAPPG